MPAFSSCYSSMLLIAQEAWCRVQPASNPRFYLTPPHLPPVDLPILQLRQQHLLVFTANQFTFFTCVDGSSAQGPASSMLLRHSLVHHLRSSTAATGACVLLPSAALRQQVHQLQQPGRSTQLHTSMASSAGSGQRQQSPQFNMDEWANDAAPAQRSPKRQRVLGESGLCGCCTGSLSPHAAHECAVADFLAPGPLLHLQPSARIH